MLDIDAELSAHMIKEENVLFPYVKKLISLSNSGGKPDGNAGTVLDPINVMTAEHEKVGEYFSEIEVLSSGYTLPEDACGSYNLYYRLLEEFEDDLHLHIHLENNILFPKALALEEELR
ncbi:Iron-sulfur cluster repair protein YtfE [bioreactor metagenome]|uniref:Iron-sulfur cluster repair protein YtfE n=1 Tax=bioreactor metagenome TaxID=1076179 RepID=A0A645DHI9_9ZZZZ